MDITKTLTDVLASQLNVDPSVIGPDTSPKTLKAWDSMKHVELVLAIEDAFGVAFGAAEVFGLNSFGGIQDALVAKLGAKAPA